MQLGLSTTIADLPYGKTRTWKISEEKKGWWLSVGVPRGQHSGWSELRLGEVLFNAKTFNYGTLR